MKKNTIKILTLLTIIISIGVSINMQLKYNNNLIVIGKSFNNGIHYTCLSEKGVSVDVSKSDGWLFDLSKPENGYKYLIKDNISILTISCKEKIK